MEINFFVEDTIFPEINKQNIASWIEQTIISENNSEITVISDVERKWIS